jgi:hypothetical protein
LVCSSAWSPGKQCLHYPQGLDLNEIFNLNFVGEFNTTTYAQYIPTKLELTKLNKFRVAERMLGAPSPILDTKWATIFTLSVAPTTGLITGTLKIEDSIPPTTIGRPPTTVKRTITISGVMLQLPSGNTSPFARGLVSIPPLNVKTAATTTSAFTMDGPVTVDPYVATAAGTAGTYTTIVDRLDNGGLAYPAGIAADGANVTFIVSPDLKTLTFNGRRLSLLGDSRPVSLAYADIVSSVKLTVTLFLNGTTGNVASGNTNYFQPVFPMPRQGSNNFPKNGTFVIKR